jgi:hypothetical protein
MSVQDALLSQKMCQPLTHTLLLVVQFFCTMARIAKGNKPTDDDSKPVARTITTRKSSLEKVDKRQISLRARASAAPISSIKVDPSKSTKLASTVTKVSTLKPVPKKSPPVPVTPSLTSANRSPSPEIGRIDKLTARSAVGMSLEAASTSGEFHSAAAAAAVAIGVGSNGPHETGRLTTARDQQGLAPAASARASAFGNFVSASTVIAPVASNIVPNNNVPDLALFGIQGATAPSGVFGADKNGTLKCCVIRGPNRFALVFRLHANHPMFFGSYWGDKFFFDSVRERRQWVSNLNISDRILKWYDRDVPQQNTKGFFIRMYVIYATGNVPPKQNLIDLGKVICEQVNRCVGNNTITTVDKDSYFWGGGSAVWSDVVGTAEAQVLLYRETNVVEPMPGFYEEHKDLILSYYHKGQLPASVGARLHAPVEAIAVSLDDGVPILRGNPDFPVSSKLPAQEDFSQLPLAATQRYLFDDDDDDSNVDNINKEQVHHGNIKVKERPHVDNEDDDNSYIYTDYATDEASDDE